MALRLKASLGTDRARLHPDLAMPFLLCVMQELFSAAGTDCTITSGMDNHTTGLHPSGKALDFRTRDLRVGQISELADQAKARLGPDYDVVVEKDHLHVEYDPKHDGTGRP